MNKLFYYTLICFFFMINANLFAQVVNWVDETGIAAGGSLVDGQVITNFAGTGITVTINVDFAGPDPRIDPDDPTAIRMRGNDGASFTLTTDGTSTLDVRLFNVENLLSGEIITLSNPNGQNITIEERASNGGGRMTVDGVAMTGSLPSIIVEDATAVVTEVDDNIGTSWNATMTSITSYTWTYNTAPGPSAREGFRLEVLSSILPVELLQFETVLLQNQTVDIKWQTASETNNDYFTVERSNNGIDWEELEKIDGAGNSNSILNYSTIDYRPYDGITYYRLKQTDLDGQSQYHDVRSVKIEKPLNSSHVVYPNPAIDEVTIISEVLDLEQIKIFNRLGQDVTSSTTIMDSNENGYITIDISKLNNGMYYLKTKTTANKIYKYTVN